MWTSEGVWAIYTKPTFLQSLDVPIKMFPNSLAALDQQILERTDYVHCFQTQLTEICEAV